MSATLFDSQSHNWHIGARMPTPIFSHTPAVLKLSWGVGGMETLQEGGALLERGFPVCTGFLMEPPGLVFGWGQVYNSNVLDTYMPT